MLQSLMTMPLIQMSLNQELLKYDFMKELKWCIVNDKLMEFVKKTLLVTKLEFGNVESI